MKKFNTIKKSRKKSKDIDEKIEYLNKECQKTGLNEIMNTTGMYQGSTGVPNQDFINFNGLSHAGYAIGLSGADGNSLGGAIIGTNSSGVEGVALSPPHPVTGVRRAASHVTDGIGSNTPLRPGVTIARGFGDNPNFITMGSAVWFFDSSYNNGEGRWLNWEWFDGGLGFWDTNFLGFFFHNKNLGDYEIGGVNIGAQIQSKIAGINFGSNGEIGPPETTVLTQNDLDDPGFLPIDIGGISKQAYNYLLDKSDLNAAARSAYYASGGLFPWSYLDSKQKEYWKNKAGMNVASAGYSDDTYNWYVKTYGAGAAGWYMNNPNSDPSNNPFLKPGDYTPFTDRASNPNTGASSVDNTGTLPDGTQIAGNYGDLKNWEKSILQNGLKVKSGASYERELRRLQQMYPGFIPQA